MNMTKKMVIAAAVLPMMFATASAYAFGGKGGQGMGGHGMGGEGFGGKCGGMDRGMMRDLNLTEEQKDQFRDFREAKRDEMKARFSENKTERQAEMQAYQTQVHELVLAKDFDEQKAQQLAQSMVEKQTERKVKMLQVRHEMLSILTDEQKTQLSELQQEKMQECSERMQKKMKKYNN